MLWLLDENHKSYTFVMVAVMGFDTGGQYFDHDISDDGDGLW